ncbi:hypothetical protein KNT64_gp012 [Pseudomonas phage PspYZU05]|uniref:Uncharacterized protein n=1 Tax=Pseudomonas phage PspYZU05 TaxID=1983556 RepID=A0A2U7NJE8_9CAUD|nr:hypothetical protein KNT64_gp012 [Pseudomonas phage PspYZU05]ASD51964.1 hypothetical protein PspYZU05_12 [Pseudomonas phage PspYZU05]
MSFSYSRVEFSEGQKSHFPDMLMWDYDVLKRHHMVFNTMEELLNDVKAQGRCNDKRIYVYDVIDTSGQSLKLKNAVEWEYVVLSNRHTIDIDSNGFDRGVETQEALLLNQTTVMLNRLRTMRRLDPNIGIDEEKYNQILNEFVFCDDPNTDMMTLLVDTLDLKFIESLLSHKDSFYVFNGIDLLRRVPASKEKDEFYLKWSKEPRTIPIFLGMGAFDKEWLQYFDSPVPDTCYRGNNKDANGDLWEELRMQVYSLKYNSRKDLISCVPELIKRGKYRVLSTMLMVECIAEEIDTETYNLIVDTIYDNMKDSLKILLNILTDMHTERAIDRISAWTRNGKTLIDMAKESNDRELILLLATHIPEEYFFHEDKEIREHARYIFTEINSDEDF